MALTEPVSMQVTGPVLKEAGGRGWRSVWGWDPLLFPLGACLGGEGWMAWPVGYWE